MSKTIEYLRCALVGALFAICGTQTLAQSNPFEAVVRVNDRVITAFEIDQRQRFLEVLRAPDTSREAVIDILIEDQLKLEAAERFGVQSTEGSMQVGMANFAAQANLSIDQFLQAIGDAGIAPETFRDFVRVSLVWGNLVRGRFSAQAQISDAEIDRAVAIGEGQGNVQVLLSEIILPLDPQVARTNSERAALIAEMTNQESFSRAARQFSVAPSRDQGGRLDWVPLSELPPAIGPLFIAMQPGEVTAPLTLGGGQALALFQLRDLRDARPAAVSLSEVTYMLVRLSDPTQASAEFERMRTAANGCDSLFTLAPDRSETGVQRVTVATNEAERSIVAALSDLDPFEMALLPGNSAAIMLCERVPELGAELSRDDIRQRLFNRRLEDLADGFLNELEANAFIERL